MENKGIVNERQTNKVRKSDLSIGGHLKVGLNLLCENWERNQESNGAKVQWKLVQRNEKGNGQVFGLLVGR